MGFIWDSVWDPCLSQIHYTFPMRIPYGYHINARCFPDGSHVNPGLIRGFLDVFYWCSVYFCDACLMFWCGYIFSKINSTVSLSRDCASLHKFMSVSLHGIPMSFSDHTLHVSHVDPIYFLYGYHMNARCFPDGSHVTPGLIPGFLDVFY